MSVEVCGEFQFLPASSAFDPSMGNVGERGVDRFPVEVEFPLARKSDLADDAIEHDFPAKFMVEIVMLAGQITGLEISPTALKRTVENLVNLRVSVLEHGSLAADFMRATIKATNVNSSKTRSISDKIYLYRV